MLSNSLEAMSSTIKRDVYGLRAPGIPIDRVNPAEPDPLALVRYSRLYWVDHSMDCHPTSKDFQAVEKFLRGSYLHWLEALSLLQVTPDGILSMRKLEGLLQNYLD